MANYFKASNKKTLVGQTLSIKIERLDHQGCGVIKSSKLAGKKPIFVAGALPNERVNIKITAQKSKYLQAKLLEVIQSSEHRIEPGCQHYLRCGGCDLQHISIAEQLVFKQQKVSDLFHRQGVDATLPWQETIKSTPWHYRRKARLGVQYDKLDQITLGFRKKATNSLTPIKNCPVLVEPLAKLFPTIKKQLTQLTLTRSVGHIEVISTDVVSFIIRQLKPLNQKDTQLWQDFALAENVQLFIDDGKTIKALTAVKPLAYTLSTQTISHSEVTQDGEFINMVFTPDDFIQVNHQVNNEMVKQALVWLALEPDDNVLDLFCGLGNFTLPIAKQVNSVIGVEGVASMTKRAADNAALNQLDNCHFFHADLNSTWQGQPWADKAFNKVLLDPARAGAYEAILQLLTFNQSKNTADQIKMILYVSCDPATLARDASLLLEQGFTLKKIALMDMFAQTKHVETMVLFSR
jgi:23S rRNA (uracil1939-C5)-methyltransferase